jgi:hypothetical protein
MQKKPKVEKHNAFWTVKNFKVDANLADRSVQWDGADVKSEFIVWFPSGRNPLNGPNEVYSKNYVAEAEVRAFDGGFIKKDARFHYCILVTDNGKEDVVLGEKSPPEMIIE